MVGYLFAGQGSQYTGMGRDLYEAFPQSKAVFDKAGEVLGFSISDLVFNGPQEELTLTHNCQPAVLTVSIAAWEAFNASQGSKCRIQSCAAGLSLGEYSALVAAKVLSFEDAVYLVKKRGEFMEQEAAKTPGKMLSIIGLDLDAVREVCAQSRVEIANINCPGQIVISGPAEEIDQAQVKARQLGAKMAVALEVSGAFHSSFMQEAGRKLAKELENIKINAPAPSMPVVCNVTGKPAGSIAEIKDNLIKQVASSVLWEDSMRFMLSCGINRFYEFGPGRVLKGLMRRIDANAAVVNIEKKEDILNLSLAAPDLGGRNAA